MVTEQLPWNDPRLSVSSDNPRKARYRALQSWYRQNALHAPHGQDRTGRPIGSLLAEEAVAENPGLNFLHEDVGRYADARIPLGGALDERRLRHNMLSSQPLCFNIFGYLRGQGTVGPLLERVFNLDIQKVESVECESAPPKLEHLKDNTAFDAFVVYRSRSGKRGFLGIETKYTESFSQQEYRTDTYAEVAKSSGRFKEGAEERLWGHATNQLWRMALLASSLLRQGAYDTGQIAVLALEDDPGVRAAVEGLRCELLEPNSFLQSVTIEAFASECRALSNLADLAETFTKRYLDLSPLT